MKAKVVPSVVLKRKLAAGYLLLGVFGQSDVRHLLLIVGYRRRSQRTGTTYWCAGAIAPVCMSTAASIPTGYYASHGHVGTVAIVCQCLPAD